MLLNRFIDGTQWVLSFVSGVTERNFRGVVWTREYTHFADGGRPCEIKDKKLAKFYTSILVKRFAGHKHGPSTLTQHFLHRLGSVRWRFRITSRRTRQKRSKNVFRHRVGRMYRLWTLHTFWSIEFYFPKLL